jgi:hypothetical protein
MGSGYRAVAYGSTGACLLSNIRGEKEIVEDFEHIA